LDDFVARIEQRLNCLILSAQPALLRRTIPAVESFLYLSESKIMSIFAEQFSALARAGVDAQVQLLSALSVKTIDSVGQLVELNIGTAKAALEDSAAFAQQVLSAKDGQSLLAITAAQTQPAVNRAVTYGRQFADIATGVHTDLTEAAERQIAEGSRNVVSLIDDLARNAPAGSENTFAIVKTAVGNSNAGYEQLNKNTRQAIKTIEGNVAAVAERLVKAGEQPTKRTSKSATH
jgi:phasin family protein